MPSSLGNVCKDPRLLVFKGEFFGALSSVDEAEGAETGSHSAVGASSNYGDSGPACGIWEQRFVHHVEVS